MDGTEPRSVIDVLADTHHELLGMFATLENAGAQEARTRQKLADRAVGKVLGHSAVENRYLAPQIRRWLSDGDAVADKMLSDNAAADQMAESLEKLEPSDSDFDVALANLVTIVREHIAEEEAALFPDLATACPSEVLLDLGAQLGSPEVDSE